MGLIAKISTSYSLLKQESYLVKTLPIYHKGSVGGANPGEVHQPGVYHIHQVQACQELVQSVDEPAVPHHEAGQEPVQGVLLLKQ